jgi:hypothetical protein
VRFVAGFAVVLLIAIAAVWEGRREGRHAVRVNIEQMLRIQTAEGATGTGAAFAITYDASARITCMIFRTPRAPVGLETCYDRVGRLMEALDGTRSGAHFWSLRYDIDAAPIEINPLALVHMRTYYQVVPGYLP